MSFNSALLVAELDSALSKASPSKPNTILRAMLELFCSDASTFSSEQVAIFDHLFGHLIGKVDQNVLVELSTSLASIANAPAKVVTQLSRSDDIMISGPLLCQSSALTEATLCEVARSKSQSHLLAIAVRPQVAETVSDILLDRGDPEIVHKIAANPGARLSMRGFSKLIKRAENDRALAATLMQRADLPDELRPFLRLASP